MWWGIGFLASLAFTVGWQTRLATIALYVLEMSMIHCNRFIINGEDLVFRVLLLYSCFAPLNASLSVDRWLRDQRLKARGKPMEAPRPLIWPIRLMQINIALIYVISLPNKLVDDIAWRNGDAIYLVMTSNLWSRGIWPQLYYGWLGKVATYWTILTRGIVPYFGLVSTAEALCYRGDGGPALRNCGYAEECHLLFARDDLLVLAFHPGRDNPVGTVSRVRSIRENKSLKSRSRKGTAET